ncbi:tryptophan synthase beta subunit-like PLP-dependent enzyme [Sistotremastrum niveocremeum HHB9708]|uniref:threonine synthase n=1 Tax=Sistotremastrum niveocremeum HHB9708 TaxID=1314777 RepID=A0A164YKU9_9AGAM|nr:tryptophan synthase beta subunit-like PLP-dependent enzyme [Sistotremastrum niveocremeum HHB9708]
MKYISTRGAPQELSFEEAVLAGLASDGGLYIPCSIPSLPADWQTTWADLSFQELSYQILSLYIAPEEIPAEDLREIVREAYSTFRAPEISPLRKLDDKNYILELFHGPTYAFKDVALQLLGKLFEYFLQRRNKGKTGSERHRITVVGATSGDTGSAAIYGLRSKADISVFILHPKGRVSPIQEAQMTTVLDANVHNVAVSGTFDDCQDIVKALFGDKAFNSTHNLGAINSINWARILAQTVYYFSSYFAAVKQLAPGTKLQYVVPTGNFGDVLAGYYAKRMGLPIEKLVVATNSNDILARFWASGKYEKISSEGPASNGAAEPASGGSDGKQATDASGVKATVSPAMDILISSNFERLLWYLAHEYASNHPQQVEGQTAGQIVNSWMKQTKQNGRVQVPVEVLELARRDFVAERVSDPQTLATIESTYSKYSYVADPHTAVGIKAAQVVTPQNPSDVVQITLSTAHPAKFSEAVERALQSHSAFNFNRDVLPEDFRDLLSKPRRVIDVERPDPELLKEVITKTSASETRPDHAASASV